MVIIAWGGSRLQCTEPGTDHAMAFMQVPMAILNEYTEDSPCYPALKKKEKQKEKENKGEPSKILDSLA